MRNIYLKYFFISIFSIYFGSLLFNSKKIIVLKIDKQLPDIKKINTFSRPKTLTILSSNGNILQKLGPLSREKSKQSELSPLIIKAFIAAEDRRFFKHNGIDFWSILRATKNNFRNKEIIEGGSTITQQLARIVFLNQEKNILRKTKEALLALKIERQLSKNEILKQYLNNVYLGSNAYGVADAAWIYFSKDLNSLTIPEAALIAGLAPAPSLYSPLVNPDLAFKRRTIVLSKMYEENFISKTDLDNFINSPLNLKTTSPKYLESSAPFFTSWVKEKITTLLTKEQLELGGLTVKTTLNLKWQNKAKEVFKNYLKTNIQGALVSIQPNTGKVRALVGGKNFYLNQFNRATQAYRSTGSTFKVFTYAAALKNGYKIDDKFYDRPKCWNKYCPKNFENKYIGETTLSDSFKYSLNTIAVELLHKVGFEEVISVANAFGIGEVRPLGKYYSLAIGAYEESLLNMTAAYAGISNQGFFNEPNPIEEIVGPNNKLLWSSENNLNKGSQALTPNLANSLNSMLEKVVSEGTGKAAKISSIKVAGKTGTSEKARDIWFIGSVPNLTTGVWFGYDDNRPTKNSSGAAAYIWKKFIESIKDDI